MLFCRVRISVTVAVAAFAMVSALRADQAAEIAALHVVAIGGAERIAGLHAYRAIGHVRVNGKTVGLTVIAARPGRLRAEMHYDDRSIIQATDGVNPPWQVDTSTRPARSTLLNAPSAEVFISEAEFDDPLVAGRAAGYGFDYAGEAKVDGRSLLRLLVTQRLTKIFYLLVDPETYFVVARVDFADDPKDAMVTRYEDFRPVAGVLSAHRITVQTSGQMTREAVFDRVEANPVLPADVFSRPE